MAKVLNSGIGMSVEEANQLFELYSQANENIEKSFGGNGWVVAV